VAASPLDSPCDGPVTYPGDINILVKSSKGRSGPKLKMDTHEIKSRTAMAKAALKKKKALCTRKMDLNLRTKPVKCYIRSVALCGAATSTLREVDQKYLESFEIWCCRRMENISWPDSETKIEVLKRVKEEKNPTYNKKTEGHLDLS
jgi:hypothetical protein